MKKKVYLFFIIFFIFSVAACIAKEHEFIMDSEIKKEFVSILLRRDKRFINVEKIEKPTNYRPNISIVPIIITARAKDGGIVSDVSSFVIVYHVPNKWEIANVGSPKFLEKEYPGIKFKLISAGYF